MNINQTAPAPTTPTCYSSVTGAPVLDTPTRDLSANLAAIVRYAVSRSDSARSAAASLGVSVPELRQRARALGVRLPWGGGR